MRNISINVTLPTEVVEYLDEKAKNKYISRATIARQFLMEHIEEEKVIETRRKGFSIRKVAEITGVRYDRVLDILRQSGIEDEMDQELEAYMDEVQKKLRTLHTHHHRS